MIKHLQASLRTHSTMAIDAYCTDIYEIHSEQELQSLEIGEKPFYILGEGSNTLFVDKLAPVLIRPMFKGISVEECQDCFELTIGAGENWHHLVEFTVSNNMPGLENLALIPGSVGAAPVQNIGAYGVEFAQFCIAVNWFCFNEKTINTLTKSECQFGYRESVFKQAMKNKGVITSVTLSLPKRWRPNLTYSGLDQLAENVTPKEVMRKVIEIRNSKLPDPAKLANTGSFFKNPVVDIETFNHLKVSYPNIPFYPQQDGRVKLAAGWLIEQAGLKGLRQGDAGVHQQQALVIVNYGNASGHDILNLAKYIIKKVIDKFSVKLSPEVRLITSSGEKTMAEL